MEDDRIPAALWVKSHMALWNGANQPAMLVRRGEAIGGSIIICVDRLDGSSVLLGARRDLDGNKEWMALGSGKPMAPDQLDAYLTKASSRDRDIWVVAVECAQGWPALDAPLAKDVPVAP